MRAAALILTIGLCPMAAHAACSDAPKSGVDWNGCEKQRLMLGKADLKGARISAARISRMRISPARTCPVPASSGSA